MFIDIFLKLTYLPKVSTGMNIFKIFILFFFTYMYVYVPWCELSVCMFMFVFVYMYVSVWGGQIGVKPTEVASKIVPKYLLWSWEPNSAPLLKP